MAKIADIEGIGPAYAEKLERAGIRTTNALLKACGDKKGRVAIAEECEISESLVLGWVNRADLFRVRGIGEEYSDLLEQSGVDSVPELAQRNPDNLFEALIKVQNKKKLVRRPPSLVEVRRWIAHAEELGRVVTH